ncbi:MULTISPECIES: hypothetical protein [Xanthomonas]|uniref:hypothetical protein n=1 Tax=Xanthomonas TaxID=338 RepID=UPI00129036FA|nr:MULTISPECIES: hypothetical protein [Xanthomonas]
MMLLTADSNTPTISNALSLNRSRTWKNAMPANIAISTPLRASRWLERMRSIDARRRRFSCIGSTAGSISCGTIFGLRNALQRAVKMMKFDLFDLSSFGFIPKLAHHYLDP